MQTSTYVVCADWLIVGGGALEAIGVLLVAWEVRADRLRAREFEGRFVRGEVRISGSGTVSANPEGGDEPTAAEPLDRLERQVADLSEAVKAEREARDEAIRGARDFTMTDVDNLRNEIRGFLREILSRSWKLRIGGVGLLLFGLALQTTGSILS